MPAHMGFGSRHHQLVTLPTLRGTPKCFAVSWVAVLGVATLALSVFAGHYDFLPGSLPFNRIAFIAFVAICLPIYIEFSRTYVEQHGHTYVDLTHTLLAVQALWIIGSAILFGSIRTESSVFALLDEVIVPTSLFFLAPVAFHRRADQLLLARSITCVGIYLGTISVLQYANFSQLLFPRYIAGFTLADADADRAVGPFLQVAANGSSMAMCIPFSLLLVGTNGRTWRTLGVLGTILCSVGCLLTLTRSVWAAGIASLVLWFGMDKRSRRLLPVVLVGTSVGIIAALAMSPTLYELVAERAGTVRSIDDRTTTNYAALQMLWNNPILGVGWGQFLSEVQDYVRQIDLVPLTETGILAHNVILSRSAELGVVGGLLLISCLVLGPAKASFADTSRGGLRWNRVAAAAFGSWFCVAMLTPMGYAFPNYLLWAAAGLALNVARPPADETGRPA